METNLRADVRDSSKFMITALAVGHSVFHWVLQSFVVVLPEIQSAFQLSAVGTGGILSARELASGFVRLPGGILSDVLRKHWGLLLATCLFISGLGSLAIGLSPMYGFLLVGVALVAMSHSMWHLPSAAALSYHFPEKRGLALSLHGVGGSVGDVAGPLVTGALLVVLTWQGILSVYAVIPIILAVTAVWAIRNIGRIRAADEINIDKSSRPDMTKRLLINPTLWGLTTVRGLRAMALVALLTTLPLYLDNDLDMNPFNRGLHIGLLIAIGLAAKPIAGHLSDRFTRKKVMVPGLAWSCVMALVMVPMNDGIGLSISVVLMGLFLYPDQPILTAATLEVVGRQVSATALGLVTFASFIMSAISPFIAGGLYQTYGMDSALYFVAGLFGIATVIMAILKLHGQKSG
ncbi:MAG: MFS transporter [Chloroflexota bacterium]|nr:MFS transporter [Chloroflexota bacterium]